jgi:hypothetical protein
MPLYLWSLVFVSDNLIWTMERNNLRVQSLTCMLLELKGT